jgi:hypothetical protein
MPEPFTSWSPLIAELLDLKNTMAADGAVDVSYVVRLNRTIGELSDWHLAVLKSVNSLSDQIARALGEEPIYE